MNNTEYDFKKIAMRVSVLSVIVNIALSAFKLVAGIIARSGAMVSDAIHSASDVFSTFVVMIGVKLAGKTPDKEHPYGHERMECVAAIILATILALTGVALGYSALTTLLTGSYADVQIPGTLALVAAIVSIGVKEWMYQYTKHHAKKIDSSALMADAWHHRSDALSSVGALVGIAAAKLGFALGDVIASLVICVFIVKAAYDIFKDAVDKMVDRSCDDEFEAEIAECVKSDADVLGISMLQTRVFGSKVYVDLEIIVDGALSLRTAHGIAERVHNNIESAFPKIKHIMIHTEPGTPSEKLRSEESK